MDFELPEEHKLAYESALAFALEVIRPHSDEFEREDDFPRWLSPSQTPVPTPWAFR